MYATICIWFNADSLLTIRFWSGSRWTFNN